ncbi:UNVERIFIED_CONTAM: hypothetical protein GTU68_020121 [Idotea baltica]|nr:hypothetical protein [Idotea baltica]
MYVMPVDLYMMKLRVILIQVYQPEHDMKIFLMIGNVLSAA